MKLTIDRSRWLRGEGPRESYLLRPSDGKMCCLGQLALQLGANKDDISGVGEPLDAATACPWPMGIATVTGLNDGQYLWTLMDTNDEPQITDTEREELLPALFAYFDIDVEFVN